MAGAHDDTDDGGQPPGRRSYRPRGPAGIEDAQPTPGAPPRGGSHSGGGPPRPDVPEGADAGLPGSVRGELRRLSPPDMGRDVAAALATGAQAIDRDEPDAALPYLEWAKHVCPRSPSVREALGVALYLAGRYRAAAAELQTYRRLAGAQDQNHLIADCLRALGRDADRIAEVVEAMRAADVASDRVAEGMIVWASALADRGELGPARAVLRRVLDGPGAAAQPSEHDLRLWYVAGELAERAGDAVAAHEWFQRLERCAPGVFDVDERLERLNV